MNWSIKFCIVFFLLINIHWKIRSQTSFENFLLAEQLYKKEDYQAARDLYLKSLAIDHDFYQAWIKLGLVQCKLAEFKMAVNSFSNAISLKLKEPEPYYLRGIALLEAGYIPSAIEDFCIAIKTNPLKTEYYENRGKAYEILQKQLLAFKDYSKIIKLDQSNSNAFLLRGNLFFKQGKYNEAISDFKKAILLGSVDTTSYYKLALCQSQIGAKTEALQSLKKASEKGMIKAKQIIEKYFGDPGLSSSKTLSNQDPGFQDYMGSFVDVRDNHVYQWVKIGGQIWMSENLAFFPQNKTTEDLTGIWIYDYIKITRHTLRKSQIYKTNGCLYNWSTATSSTETTQDICPAGWHVPTYEDWYTLFEFVGDTGYTELKSLDYWQFDGRGENWSGFNAKPCGIYNKSRTIKTIESPRILGLSPHPNLQFKRYKTINLSPYDGLGEYTIFWSSTPFNEDLSLGWSLETKQNNLTQIPHYKHLGLSVRCIKNKPGNN